MCRNEINYINVIEEPTALYDYMRKYDFLDDDAPEEMPENFDKLIWFEGDPDIIKYDGYRGYFDFSPVDTKRENICFVWFDCYTEEEWQGVVDLLDKFWNHQLVNPQKETWEIFDKLETGVAYRGGVGYVYRIWMEQPKNVFQVHIYNEMSCDDVTPMPLNIDFTSFEKAIEEARKALLSYDTDELLEAYIFAGEKKDALGNVTGEPEAIYTISNLDRKTTAEAREKSSYVCLEVDEYLIND